jgi:enterochelin esterase-like enzyme
MKKYFFLLIFPGLMIVNNHRVNARSDSKNMENIAIKTANGTTHRFSNFSSKFMDSRNIDIWLPDGYTVKKKYAVLYMHDGQMLFDSTINWNHQEWGIDETLGKLIKENKIKDCIVVGIWNTPKRHVEYFPQKALDYLSESEKTDLLNITVGENKFLLMEGGPISDSYLKFIVTELKPFIDSTFSTRKDQPNTFIAGSSMGGLISMYAICEYPDIFGGAACLSTHWLGTIPNENNPVPGAFLKYLRDHLPLPANHKLYFDYGSETVDAFYKPFQLQADEIIKAKGYTSKNWITLEFPGESHSEKAWNNRFNIPAGFLLRK